MNKEFEHYVVDLADTANATVQPFVTTNLEDAVQMAQKLGQEHGGAHVRVREVHRIEWRQ